MNRIEQLEKEIKEYLDENDIEELYITTPPSRWDDITIWLANLYNITSNLSTICIECVETTDDVRWQITTYKKVEDSNMSYNIILNCSAEKINITSIKDLAEVINDYEILASKLSLTIK